MRDGLFQLLPMLLGHRLHFRFWWWYRLLTSAPFGKLELGKRFELLTEHRALLLTKQVQSTGLCEPSKMVRRAGVEPAGTSRSTRYSAWRVFQFRHLRLKYLFGTGGEIRTRKTLGLSQVCMPNSITPA